MHGQEKRLLQAAWDLFIKGDLGGADRAITQAGNRIHDASQRPIPDILLVKAFYLSRMGRASEARSLFGRVLELCPDDAYAHEGYLLSMQDSLQIPAEYRTPTSFDAPRGSLLIGIGTGRSGSTTLTRLWSAQQSTYCSHEHPPRLAWSGNLTRLSFQQRRFELLLKKYAYVGDVAHWWLPHIDELIKIFPDIRIVILQRERESTIKSFLNVKGGPGKGAINHWTDHDGSFWQTNAWDECYPHYQTTDMYDALGRYWDDYYRVTADLENCHPGMARTWHTESLGEGDIQREILEFCGFTNPVIQEDIHCNRGNAFEGQRIY